MLLYQDLAGASKGVGRTAAVSMYLHSVGQIGLQLLPKMAVCMQA